MSTPAVPTPSTPDAATTTALPLLTEALHRRRAVQLLYDGAWRVVHPHAVGRTARGGLSLLAWQTAGFGRSAEPEGWRLFDLGRVEAAEVLQASFAPRARPASGRWTAGIKDPPVAAL